MGRQICHAKSLFRWPQVGATTEEQQTQGGLVRYLGAHDTARGSAPQARVAPIHSRLGRAGAVNPRMKAVPFGSQDWD